MRDAIEGRECRKRRGIRASGKGSVFPFSFGNCSVTVSLCGLVSFSSSENWEFG